MLVLNCLESSFYRPHRKDEGRYCFYRCLSVNISRGGVPPSFPMGVTPFSGLNGGTPVLTWEGGIPHPDLRRWYPHQSRPGKGVPPFRPGKGVPLPHPGQVPGQGGTPNQNSIACTCYAAGGMSLAFLFCV